MTEKFTPNAEVYDADYFRRMYRPHWLFRNARKYRERDAALLRLVKPHPGLRVLELGSARGDTSFFFAPRVAEVVGVDAAAVAVEAARAEAARRGLPNVRFVEADARALPDLGGLFGCVLLADFVEHLPDEILVPALAEARRVLAPGGALAVYTPNAQHWAEIVKTALGLQQKDHIAVRPAPRVVELVARAGFRLDELFFTASPYPLLGAADRAMPSLPLCRFRTCLRAKRPR